MAAGRRRQTTERCGSRAGAGRLGALSRRPLGLDAPWGWTWVDDAPWGFAPFHYGRWVNCASAGAGCRAPTSRARSTRRRWSPWSAAPQCRRVAVDRRRRPAGRVVPARAARSLRAELSHQPGLCARRSTSRTSPTSRSSTTRSTTPTASPTGASSQNRRVPECGDGGSRRGDDGPPASRPRRGAVAHQSAGAGVRGRCAARVGR